MISFCVVTSPAALDLDSVVLVIYFVLTATVDIVPVRELLDLLSADALKQPLTPITVPNRSAAAALLLNLILSPDLSH
ncbi:hypothetical protein D3C86_2158070 [compost metagenome]